MIGGHFSSSTIDLENGVVLNNSGSRDGMLIKYGSDGEVVWGVIEGRGLQNEITCIIEIQDEEYVAVGSFSGNKNLGDGEVLKSEGNLDGMIIKYNGNKIYRIKVEVKQGETVGGEKFDEITCIKETEDRGYIVGGYFNSSRIDLGNGVVLTNKSSSTSYSDGMLIKYGVNGEVEWGKAIGGSNDDRINCIVETTDGGYLVGGDFYSKSIDLGNGVVLNNRSFGNFDGMIIKYGANGEVEWGKEVGGSRDDRINCITETEDGGYLVGGYFDSNSIDLGNGVVLNNHSSYYGYDGMLIKYDEEGNVEWGKEVGGSHDDRINCITETEDGGYLVGGYFNSSRIDLENGVGLKSNGSNSSDGMLIKYGSNGEVEWGKEVGGSRDDRINCITETEDGGYLVGGYFLSNSIDLGNGIVLNNKSSGTSYSDGMLIKYGVDGNVEWGKAVGESSNDYIDCIIETKEGGYLVGGYFRSEAIDLGNGVVLNNKSSSTSYSDGMLIKYEREGEVEWGKAVGGNNHDYINYITETREGGYLVGGYFNSSSLYLRNELVLKNNGSSDGMILKVVAEMGVPEVQELVVENTRKEFKITTDVKEIDGIKGGTISGEDKSVYEKVKYGENSTKEIIMAPDTDYEIIVITVNGKEYQFTSNEDGTYTMPQFENMTEDKHIVVTFAMKDNKITINKVDRRTRVLLSGVKFRLDQIEERTEPENVIGEITNNGQTYVEINEANEIKGVIGEITDNGQEYDIKVDTENPLTDVLGELTDNGAVATDGNTYNFVEQEGKYVPTNGKTYQVANGGTAGIGNTTANSYMKIDLIDKEGQYVVIANARVSSQSSYDYGYATITETTEAPAYNNGTGRFVYIAGTSSSVTTAKDYTSTTILEGGKVYYLHLGYRKNASTDTGEDQTVFNSIKVCKRTSSTYNFVEQEGKYVPTNSKTYQIANVEGATAGKQSTVANSYMKIDLKDKEGKYRVVVNAQVSSQSSYDYGYATITENTARPAYNNSTGRFVYIAGTQTAKDYESTVVLEGGKEYYLHLGYYKNASTDTGEDQIVFNSIKVYGTTSPTYYFENNEGKYESNNQRKDNTVANSYIPIDLRSYTGKYNLIVNAQVSSQSSYDYGYATVTENTTRPSYSSTTGRFIYISGTQEATDYTTVLEGGKLYYLHLGYYKNASTSTGDDKFTINNIQVTLNDSELYHTEVETNSQGQAITQLPFGKYSITEIEAPEGYNKLEEPVIVEFRADENHEFTIENEAKAKVIINHYKAIKNTDGSYTYTEEKLAESEKQEGKENDEYTSTPHLDLGKYELIKDEKGEYIIPENATGKLAVEETIVNYYYVEKEIPLTVHHYIEGTEEKVPLKDGTEAEDVINKGKENEEYTTTPISDELLSEEYELVEIPENSEGIYTGEEVIVIYYYKKAKRELELNKYSEDGITPLEGVKFTINKKEETDDSTENSIPIEQTDEIIYTTNSQGKIKAELEVGTYEVTEIEVPEGYQLPEGATTEIEITKETEIAEIDITNTKKRGTVITHHYVEGTENKVPKEDGTVVEDETQTGIVGEPFATKVSEEVPVYYEFVSSSEKTSGEYTEETQEIIYYYKLKEYNYTVEYYYDNIKDNDKIETTKAKYKEQIEEYIDKVKDGYKLEKTENLPLTIEQDETQNVIKIYYVKRQDLKYTVNYLEKGTNKELHKPKTEENQEFQKVITSSNEIISIDGYRYDSIDTESITIVTDETKNVINIYYVKRSEYSYTVNYLEKETNKVLHAPKTEENQEFEKVITSSDEIIRIEGYVYDSSDKESITIQIDSTKNIINIYYTKRKDLQYTVNYLEKGTNKELHEQKVVENQEFEKVIKSSDEIITISGYDYDSSDKESITIQVNETENVINIYYTKRQDLKYTVNYLEKDTNKVIHEPKIEENQEFEKVITSSEEIIEISGYKYDSVDKESITIQVDETKNVINIYYISKATTYTVNYLEEDTNEILHEPKIEEGLEDEIVTSSKEIIDIEGYEYSSCDKESITLKLDETENVINIYYIKRSDLRYTVNYLEKDTEEVLHEPKEAKEQVFGGVIKSSTEVIEIPGYKYDSVDKESITIQVDETKNIINIYYTKRTDIKYTVEYYYDGIKDEEETEEYEATFQETIEEYEDKIRENYVLVEEKGIPLIIEVDESKNIIQIYYVTKAKAKVQYIDKITNEIIEEETEEGYIGKEFKTEAKDFEGYILVEEPEEKTVPMEEEEVVLKYYYIHVSSGVIEKHIDIDTDEILYNTTYEGNEGDEYKTEPKEFENYDFVEDKYPENAEGTMKKEVITVNYYYKKRQPITITVKYIDKDTKEEIEETITITDYEGKEYKTEQKEIEGYEFIEVKGETEGKITEEKEIIYYYQKIKEPEIPGEGGGDDNTNTDINGKPADIDQTTTDKEIPSAGLTKEQIAIIVVTVMSVITVVLTVVAIKGTILSKKYKN